MAVALKETGYYQFEVVRDSKYTSTVLQIIAKTSSEAKARAAAAFNHPKEDWKVTAVSFGPVTVNGFKVLTSTVFASGRRLLLVDRGEEFNDRYVVSWHISGDDEWFSGRYCCTIERAIEVYNERVNHWMGWEE